MTDITYLYDSYTVEQVREYAFAWKCTYAEAEETLARLTIDQPY